MKWYVKGIVYDKKRGEYVNPCGSDYGIIISDLKTLRGVKNRIAKKWWRKNVEFIEIYKIGDTYLNKEQYIDSVDVTLRMDF